MILDVGCPILHCGMRLNCCVIVYSHQIILIRLKVYLASDLNYREMRYFALCPRKTTQTFILPKILRSIVGQTNFVIRDAVIDTLPITFAAESCEEPFTPASPHVEMFLNGVSIFTNSIGSHHELRKLDTKIQLLLEATRKAKEIYIYLNQQGADGGREYYDGSVMIMVNDQLIVQGSHFSLKDVEVITATVDLDRVTSSRSTAYKQYKRWRHYTKEYFSKQHFTRKLMWSILLMGLLHRSENHAYTSQRKRLLWVQSAIYGITCAALVHVATFW